MPADCLVGVKLAAGASAAVEQISFGSQSANGPRPGHRRAVWRARDRRPGDRIGLLFAAAQLVSFWHETDAL